MTGGRKYLIATGLAMLGPLLAEVVITSCQPVQSTSLTGAVLEGGSDPRRQTPLANAEVSAGSATASASTKSDASGLFHLTLSPAVKRSQTLTLKISHPGYQTFESTAPVKDQIYIARLAPLHVEQTAASQAAEIAVGDLRVRYSVKTSATMNVGSFARTFEIHGSGGVPCDGQPSCSPDGKWKAARGSVSYDAGDGNEFREVRVSCIAGPCAFTSIERDSLVDGGRVMNFSALDWSDTATFLAEAEVSRTQVNDAIRYSIPVVFGNGMDFTLAASAEGPSIEADLNGGEIVFPLGPDLFLSWATCTLKTDKDGAKLYRCELKPGYKFR